MEDSLMSTNTALRQRPLLRSESIRSANKESQAPQLRVVEGSAPHRSRIILLVSGLLIVLLSIAVPMSIQTHMAQRAYEIRNYQLELNELRAQTWTLQTTLRELESPVALERKARELGMVPAHVSGTITLSSGVVEGGTVSR